MPLPHTFSFGRRTQPRIVVRMKSSDKKLLRLIAVFKFFKAAMLIALSLGVFRLLHRDVGETVEHWVSAMRLDPGNHLVMAALVRASLLTPEQIKKLGIVGLIYAGLFATEGTGLWLLKRWGEWVTVIITGSLLPLEIYELYRHATAIKLLVLVINVATVGYLIYRIKVGERANP